MVYSEFADVSEEGIDPNMGYTFNPVPFDSTDMISGRFDVIILVRYANTCASKSVIFDVESISLAQDQPDSVRVEIPLFDNDGIPYGKGNLGVFETSMLLATDMIVPEGYEISLATPLQTGETKGIIDIGIKLVRSGKKEFDLPSFLHLKEILPSI
ncbi:MAG: gliding motility lipoprotein GldH [Bacteroides sp.]|nr:gliding motility lipoprotein GldH [Bacteroides sp.]